MKKVVIGLLLCGMFLSGCTSKPKSDSKNSSTDNSAKFSTSQSTEEKIALYVSRPSYYLENNNFHLAGKANPKSTVTVKSNGQLVKDITPAKDGSFSITIPLPESESTEYEITDGLTSEKVTVQSKPELQKEADEAEAKRKEQEEQKAEAEKKAAEEADAKEKAEKKLLRKEKKKLKKQFAKLLKKKRLVMIQALLLKT